MLPEHGLTQPLPSRGLVLGVAGRSGADSGLDVLKSGSDQDDQISAEDREHIQIMIDQLNQLEAEITPRWQADSSSSSCLATTLGDPNSELQQL